MGRITAHLAASQLLQFCLCRGAHHHVVSGMTVLVLVPCTASKRHPAPPELRRRAVPGVSVPTVSADWLVRTQGATGRVPAHALYMGGGWSLAKKAQEAVAARGGDAKVVSAGLGLVDWSQRVPPYNMTFTSGNADTVPRGDTAEGRAEWWDAIGGSKKLQDAVLEGGHDLVIAALSDGYVDAVTPALARIAGRMGADRVIVLACGVSPFAKAQLGGAWVRLEAARMKHLGGTVGNAALVALNHVLTTVPADEPLTASAIRACIDALPAPVALYPKRARLGTEHAVRWIHAALAAEGAPTSASGALRRYRGEGFALEQKAFHRLFDDILSVVT